MSLSSYIKNTADHVYSKYIRIKETDRNGYCTCVTCGVVRKWDDRIDAGHCFSRDNRAIRFDDRNVHPQCRRCNRFQSGQVARYMIYMRKRYGQDALDELDAKSRLTKQFTLDDLKAWVKEWRKEIAKMSTVKNI